MMTFSPLESVEPPSAASVSGTGSALFVPPRHKKKNNYAVLSGLVVTTGFVVTLYGGTLKSSVRSLRASILVRNATGLSDRFNASKDKGQTAVASTSSSSSFPMWDFLPNASSWCRRDQIIDGQWVPEHMEELPYLPMYIPVPFCLSYIEAMRSNKSGEWDTYAWVPNAVANNACHFAPWDKEMFCSVAKYATVLVVGDSLSWEHYSSLAHLLGVPVVDTYQIMSYVFDMNIGISVCGGRTRIVYRRDDYLAYLRDALLESESPILPQVLILNRGAHYEADVPYLKFLRQTLDVVEEWQRRCDALNVKCHFFWRTTVPGHINCRNFTSPVNDKAAIEAYVENRSNYDGAPVGYHWYDFQHQNLMAEAELKRRNIPHQILDGYHINVLRPDGHADCLHSCSPGKMDVYNQLLLHYLLRDRSPRDVGALRTSYEEHGWDLNRTTAYNLKNYTRREALMRIREMDRRIRVARSEP